MLSLSYVYPVYLAVLNNKVHGFLLFIRLKFVSVFSLDLDWANCGVDFVLVSLETALQLSQLDSELHVHVGFHWVLQFSSPSKNMPVNGLSIVFIHCLS